MKCKSLVLALIGLGGVAAAQPGPPPAPPPPPADTTTTTTTTEPPPNPTPPPRPQPTPVVTEDTVSAKPEGLSFALGVGYTLPTKLDTPNTTSARLRLGSGLTFEPAAVISNTTTTTTSGAVPPVEMTTKETELRLDLLVRFPIVNHGKVDLEVLGGAGFDIDKVNPDGDYNTKTVTSFEVLYGLGIGYWITHHWQFSLSTLNPLVNYVQTKTQTGPGMSVKNGETTIGVIFVPSVMMMIHLYN